MKGNDCNTLFTVYYNELSASCAFCVFLAVLSLIYSVFTCINCCSPDAAVQPPTVTVAAASQVPGGVYYAPATVPVHPVPYTPQQALAPGQPVVYSQGYMGAPTGQVMYQQQPQHEVMHHQPQYVYQEPTPMAVLEAQPVAYEPQQTKWT